MVARAHSFVGDIDLDECFEHETNNLGYSGFHDLTKVGTC